MKNIFFIITILFILSACVKENAGVKIETKGINSNTLFAINGQDADGKSIDLGERILSDGPMILTVTVQNTTQYPYTDIDLTFTTTNETGASTNFNPTSEGEIKFPGDGGTCSRILAPNSSCELKIAFSPRDEREYLENVTLVFKNYIKAESHTGTFKIIAGTPASLSFTNDKTQYTFGQLVGTSQVPVVERDEQNTFTEEIEVINKGGLPAKSLTVNLSQSCVSTLTNACPTDMDGAFSIENACPQKLYKDQSCKVKVTFTPKNKDPSSGPTPEEIKEITYRSNVNFAYIRDTSGATAALNGYFKSISTNIKAKFKVAITNITFETPVVVGNRDTRTVRISNLGYREGEIKSLQIKDAGGALIGTCSAQTGTNILNCKDNSNVAVPLSTLPFTIKDRNNCLTLPPTSPVYVNVGSGCLFDITFQPSVTFLTNKDTEFQNLQFFITYDSRWIGQEDIISTKLFNLSGKSLAAARLELSSVTYNGVTYTVSGNNPWVADFGRLALQSSLFFKRKTIVLAFKNNGSVSATNISIKDGMNISIPVGGTAISLGSYSPKFFASVVASESSCTVVAPGENCTISASFAPIGLSSAIEEDANMFDIEESGIKYKVFKVSYNNGSLYSDSNLTDPTDISNMTSEGRLAAALVRKGLLMQYSEDSRNITPIGTNYVMAGDTSYTYLYLQNIGSGDVPYIRIVNPPSTLAGNYDTVLESTSNPASLGADYDCLNIVDYDLTYTVPSNEAPTNRIGNFQALPKEKTCVMTVKFKTSNRQKKINATSCSSVIPSSSNLEEGTRFFSREAQNAGGDGLWEYCITSGNNSWNNINTFYYDGDGSTYGNKFSLNTYSLQQQQYASAKLIPYSPSPALTATLYRPAFTLPQLRDQNNVVISTTKNIPERWFYGIGIGGTGFFYDLNDPGQASPFIQGDDSRLFAQTLTSFADVSQYDYVLYIGSFPQGSGAFNFNYYLKSFGDGKPNLLSLTPTFNDASFSTVSLPSPLPMTISVGGDVGPTVFQFDPSVPGEHVMELSYSYAPGRHTSDLYFESSQTANNAATIPKEIINQKVLIIAYVEATGSYPMLSLNSADYDVSQNDGAPPTVTLQAGSNQTLTWNSTTASSTLTFDTIKLNTSTAGPNDVYAQKLITLTNSTALPLQDLKFSYRSSTSAFDTKIVTNSFQLTGTGTACTQGMTLNAGASCTLKAKYQPLNGDSSDNFTLTFIYKMFTGRYVMQNLGISLIPRAPGNLIASGINAESINYKSTPSSSNITRSSYPLSFGTVTLDTVPKVMAFTNSSGTYKKMQIVNTESTKASLLLSYQKYVTNNSLRGYSPSSPAPTSLIPLAGEYRNFGGIEYAPIFLTKYGDNSTRFLVEASKGCLFGDDESDGAIPDYQKGFNSLSVTPCYLIVTLSANFQYLLKSISVSNGDDMRDNAAELWYFSVARSSTASFWLHVKGAINPDVSLGSGAYGNVESLENKTTTFSVPQMTPNNSALGSIVGLRVLRATSSSTLANPYSTGITTYYDIRPYTGGTQYANFSGLLNSNYYYYRVVAIRYDARFNVSGRFIGLNPGEYLSAATNIAGGSSYGAALKVLVPPTNHYYFHSNKLLVEKTLHNDTVSYDNYTTGSGRCTGKAPVSLKDPSTLNLNYTLISRNAWTALKATPAATTYANMNKIAHWLSDAPVSINTVCSGMSGYIANMSSQNLTATSTFYIRNSSSPNADVNQAIGGIPGTSYYDYNSYIDGVIGYGSARCMVTLP
ncbi:MAG: hypothetical protein AB7I27_10220 [Bacteriovoracaceae bacterium]